MIMKKTCRIGKRRKDRALMNKERNKKFIWKSAFAICLGMLVIFLALVLLCCRSSFAKQPWKSEYEHCLEIIEYKIDDYTQDVDNPTYDKNIRKCRAELWTEFIKEFQEYVDICIENESETVGNSEEIYRKAMLMLRDVYINRSEHSYLYVTSYELNMEKELDEWEAMYDTLCDPIDVEIQSSGCFDDEIRSEMTARAWENEFNNCLEVIREEVEQADIDDKEQVLHVLTAHEKFVKAWAECNAEDIKMNLNESTDDNLSYEKMANDEKAFAFRIGTIILVDRYKDIGNVYIFSYDYEDDYQEMIDKYGEE